MPKKPKPISGRINFDWPLVEGGRYRVKEPIGNLDVGEIVTVKTQSYNIIDRDSSRCYCVVARRADGSQVTIHPDKSQEFIRQKFDAV